MSTSENFLPPFNLAETPSKRRNKVRCQIRNYDVPATPEERVRQRVLHWLINTKGWTTTLIQLERAYAWESDANRSYIKPDIELLDEDGGIVIVVECKHEDVPLSKAVDDQAIEYAIKSGAEYIWVTNGEQHKFLVPNKRGGWKAVSSIAPLGETYEPPTGRIAFPDVRDAADVERYLDEMGLGLLNNQQLVAERRFTLALYKAIFEVFAEKKRVPYSYDGVHLLEYVGAAFHQFTTPGGFYYARYADFVAATRGRVEAMSIAINMWDAESIRLCVGASKAGRQHHALQADFTKYCFWDEGRQRWDVWHDGRMQHVPNAVVLKAVREANCGHWIYVDDDGKEWAYLGSLPVAESVRWANSKEFVANLLHYGIIRTNLREAREHAKARSGR